jgi:hypothetical protein
VPITTNVVSSNTFYGQVYSIQHYVLKSGRWYSLGAPVSATNKTDHHDITEILLKVALNTVKQTKPKLYFIEVAVHRVPPNTSPYGRSGHLQVILLKVWQKTTVFAVFGGYHVPFILKITSIDFGKAQSHCSCYKRLQLLSPPKLSILAPCQLIVVVPVVTFLLYFLGGGGRVMVFNILYCIVLCNKDHTCFLK